MDASTPPPDWLAAVPALDRAAALADAAYAGGDAVYPPRPDLFRALWLTPFAAVRVVILGQDPYHNPGQAHGLAFSVPKGQPPPPSLRNIAKEIASDLGVDRPALSDLSGWSKQGVLLLNTGLTVDGARGAGSHAGLGWAALTDAIIAALAHRAAPPPPVFILWGAHARAKKALVPPDSGALVIESAHPSPLSARNGFFGSRPFSQANDRLVAQGGEPVAWACGLQGCDPTRTDPP